MITTENVRNNYVGSSTTNTYNYSFEVFEADQLAAVVQQNNIETTLVLNQDYTISGVGTEGGGSIVLIAAGQNWIDGSGFLLTSVLLTLTRAVPHTQDTDIRNQGSYYPEVIETTFDKMVMQIQQLNDGLSRTLKAQITDYSTSLFLPTLAQRKGNLLGFDSNGNPTAIASLTGAAFVSAYVQTLLALTNAAAFLTGLGFHGVSGPVGTADLDNLAVTTAKIAPLNITAALLDTGILNALTTVIPAYNDYIAIADQSDSFKIKKGLASIIGGYAFRAVNATDGATMSDSILSLSGASFTETLPTPVGCPGKEFEIIHAGTSLSQTYTIGSAAGNVAGGSTTTLNTTGETLRLRSDGTNWVKVSRYIPAVKTTYTPGTSWLTNATFTGTWQRIGKRAHFEVLGTLSGAPTSASLFASIAIGMTIDTAALLSTGTAQAGIPVGIGYAYDLSATQSYQAMIKYVDSSDVGHYNAAIQVPTTQISPFTFATGDLVYFSFDLPIAGWND